MAICRGRRGRADENRVRIVRGRRGAWKISRAMSQMLQHLAGGFPLAMPVQRNGNPPVPTWERALVMVRQFG